MILQKNHLCIWQVDSSLRIVNVKSAKIVNVVPNYSVVAKLFRDCNHNLHYIVVLLLQWSDRTKCKCDQSSSLTKISQI